MDPQQHLREMVVQLAGDIDGVREEIRLILVDLRELIMVEDGPLPPHALGEITTDSGSRRRRDEWEGPVEPGRDRQGTGGR